MFNVVFDTNLHSMTDLGGTVVFGPFDSFHEALTWAEELPYEHLSYAIRRTFPIDKIDAFKDFL